MTEQLVESFDDLTPRQAVALARLVGDIALLRPSSEGLTPDEQRLLEFMLEGNSHFETKRQLGAFSAKWVRVEGPGSIRTKLGARNRLHLPRIAISEGLVPPAVVQEPIPEIGERQAQIVELMSYGASTGEVSKILDISKITVHSLKSRLFGRLGSKGDVNGVYLSLSVGLLDNNRS